MNLVKFVLLLLPFGAFASSVPKGQLDQAAALKLFDSFASDTSITFRLPEKGCEKRSYLMKNAMLKKGIAVRSFVLVTNGDMRFRLKSPYAPKGITEWHFHTAPVVDVWGGGKAVPSLIDPSSFSGPVTVADALKALVPEGKCAKVEVAALKEHFNKPLDFNTRYGSSPCYWFEASPFFYSPIAEDLTMYEQLRYTGWNEYAMEDSLEMMKDCQEEQQERVQMVLEKKIPQKPALCLID